MEADGARRVWSCDIIDQSRWVFDNCCGTVQWIQCTGDDCNVWMHTDCLEKKTMMTLFVVYVEQYLVKYYPVFGKNMHFDY